MCFLLCSQFCAFISRPIGSAINSLKKWNLNSENRIARGRSYLFHAQLPMPLRRLVDSRYVGAAHSAQMCVCYFWIFRFSDKRTCDGGKHDQSNRARHEPILILSLARCMWHNIWSETGPQDAECRYECGCVVCLRTCVCDGFGRRDVKTIETIIKIKSKALGLSPFISCSWFVLINFPICFTLYDRRFVILFANYCDLTHSSTFIINRCSRL